MFQALFLRRVISFACILLWAEAEGMANPTGGFVNHAEMKETVPKWVRCLKYNPGMAQPANATRDHCPWHTATQTRDHDRNLNFNFSFNRNPVDVRLFGLSVGPNDDALPTNASISVLVDRGLHIQVECPEVNYPCHELKFGDQELPNTLVLMSESLRQRNFSIDCFIYKEDACSSTNNEVTSTGTAMSSTTNVNEASATSEVGPNTGTAPSTTLGPMIGGIAAGIMLLTITIVGVLWYRFKNSRKSKPLSAAPLVKELYPSLEPPCHIITGSMTHDVDPPGYTKKNAFFGITSPLANYITSRPGASEKRQALV